MTRIALSRNDCPTIILKTSSFIYSSFFVLSYYMRNVNKTTRDGNTVAVCCHILFSKFIFCLHVTEDNINFPFFLLAKAALRTLSVDADQSGSCFMDCLSD